MPVSQARQTGSECGDRPQLITADAAAAAASSSTRSAVGAAPKIDCRYHDAVSLAIFSEVPQPPPLAAVVAVAAVRGT